jgi:hypothetical protein
VFPKVDIKSLSRSDTMLRGRPFSQYQRSKNKMANSLAVSLVDVGIIRISDPSRSVIVRIQSYPLSSGRGPMKSIDMDWQRSSGTGKGGEVQWVLMWGFCCACIQYRKECNRF